MNGAAARKISPRRMERGLILPRGADADGEGEDAMGVGSLRRPGGSLLGKSLERSTHTPCAVPCGGHTECACSFPENLLTLASYHPLIDMGSRSRHDCVGMLAPETP